MIGHRSDTVDTLVCVCGGGGACGKDTSNVCVTFTLIHVMAVVSLQCIVSSDDTSEVYCLGARNPPLGFSKESSFKSHIK